MFLHRPSFLVVTVFALLLGCSDGNGLLSPAHSDESIIEGQGTVRFSSLEIGCWLIAPDTGRQLEPINLPAEFQEDGLRIYFRAELTRNVLTYCQMGAIIRILQIERL